MSRPVIGVCTYLETIRWGAWEDRAAMIPEGYVAAVQRAGGLAVLLPPDPAATEDPDTVLDLIDGLILAGGVDVDPAAYGESAHEATDAPDELRDAFELALARRALERDMPLLGICRGMQIINVAYGGGIEQHLPDVLGHEEHRHTPGTFADHEVRLVPDSLAARAAGVGRTPVKSHHHQGIKEVGEGLQVTGWAIEDDAVEALEDPSCPFVLGVLWHPEEDENSRLIKALVSEVS